MGREGGFRHAPHAADGRTHALLARLQRRRRGARAQRGEVGAEDVAQHVARRGAPLAARGARAHQRRHVALQPRLWWCGDASASSNVY
jgi:hypothetical protein